MIHEIISSLNKEEKRFFKIFTNRTLKSDNRKDIILFDYLNTKKIIDDSELLKKLNLKNKNSLYQLKNRLFKDLNKSMLLQHFDKEKDLFSLSNILLSRVYKRKGNLGLAYKFLKKAEEKALLNETFELIALIYNEVLKLAYELVTIDVEKYINKQRKNKKKLDIAQEMDLVLAAVMYKIKTAQNFSTDKDIFFLLNQTLKKFTKNKLISDSPKFRIKVFQAVSRGLLQKKNYNELEKYLLKTYSSFKKDNLFNKTNHENKLMMLTYITNSLYKNKKYEKSLEFANELKSEMLRFDNMLYNKFLFFYYNTLVINYSTLNKKKALKILSQAKENVIIKNLPTFGVFIYLNTALIYFDLGNFKISKKNIRRLILQKDFMNLDKSFKIQIYIAELIITYSTKEFDQLESKIIYLKSKFKTSLSENKRDSKLIEILSDLIFCNNLYADKKLQNKIKSLINKISDDESDDQDIISYNYWLKNITKKGE